MSAKVGSMYVRVKRGQQTVFLHVEPTDSFAVVKQKLGKVRSAEKRGRTTHSRPRWTALSEVISFLFFLFRLRAGFSFAEVLCCCNWW